MRRTEFEFEGVPYVFFIDRENDAIQSTLASGKLFDYSELKHMAEVVEDGDTIIDVGANVGNHTIYFAKRFPASAVIPFEPSAEALAVLTANLDANDCDNVDRRFLGFGLSDAATTATLLRGGANNLGNTRIVPDGELRTGNPMFSRVPVLRGDDALAGVVPKLIKIDVEGHEMSVLAGMDATITEHRPVLFIEIAKGNDAAFQEWRSAHRYEIEWTDRHYATATNYLLRG
jgi:FkbM family methyltransferase